MTLTTEQVRALIADGESFTVEFKSDRQRLNDGDICENVVCLANADGGVLLIGVENDGTVTGAQPRHGKTTDPRRVQAVIFNNTSPSINTRVSVHLLGEHSILAIEVDAYPTVCATLDGRSVRRVDGIDGPECRPFLPHEHISRRIDLGLLDYSAQLVDGATVSDLDPLEIERMRQLIAVRSSESPLRSLDDIELLKSLGLVASRNSELIPNIAGMLLLGRTETLRDAVPTHEVAFQVLDAAGNTPVNEWYRDPLLRVLEAIDVHFTPIHTTREAIVGPYRLPIPNYASDAFREAVNNAIVHRDYSRRGEIHIQFYPDHLFISNPGGFLEGISYQNLLTHEPKPRNPLLADVFLRIGLVERTGRGVDRIYQGQLRYGRPLPDYTASDREAVRLRIRGGDASLEFAVLVFEESRSGATLDINELLVLDHLQHERRVAARDAARIIQQDLSAARSVLERLVERGLVEARGERGGRFYLLSASVYRRLGMSAGYIRTRGFDAIQQGTMVVEYVRAYGKITRADVMQLCGLKERQATYLLQRLVGDGKLRLVGQRRYAHYELADDTQ